MDNYNRKSSLNIEEHMNYRQISRIKKNKFINLIGPIFS